MPQHRELLTRTHRKSATETTERRESVLQVENRDHKSMRALRTHGARSLERECALASDTHARSRVRSVSATHD